MDGGRRAARGRATASRSSWTSRARPLLFVALDGGRYAYRPACPACGASLAGAALAGAELRCVGCGTRYDVRHAGRGLDASEHHLEPVPLLVGADGVARVALGATA